MKNLFTYLIIAFLLPVTAFSQYGYAPEVLSGALKYTDLSNASSTVIGTTVTNLVASDFDLSGTYYGISGDDNNLYIIDTSNASFTLVGSVTPPGSEFWSGMACDPTDGTMYICSTDGNTNSFYTIDVTSAAITLVGTNAEGDGVVGIAFDDSGQMYAIYLVRLFYLIDKTTAAATLVGNLATTPTAFPHHGLDFSSSNQTMYMVGYNAFSFDTELWTIDLATANNTLVGSLGVWTASLAVEPHFSVGFSADTTEICEGDVVNFSDGSIGASTWEWTFEGGTPASSTAQNPTVTYNTAGTYDVEIIVTDGGTISDTLLMVDMIDVSPIPAQANTPTGPLTACQDEVVDYTTDAVPFAIEYNWDVDPTTAGTITGTGTTGTFTASSSYTGAYDISVRAENMCGDGTWSPDLACELFVAPLPFTLFGNGAYCEGDPGAELKLDGSEPGVDYELYLDDVATGTIMTGTGDTLNFGYQSDEGVYTALADNGACLLDMFGSIWVHTLPAPGQAAMPTGPEMACNNESTDYNTTGTSNADTLIWMLDPANAGTIIGGGEDVTIEWRGDFSGTASLTVYGQNDCGDGAESNPLEIEIYAAPTPEISGLALVCNDEQADYQTEDNAGHSYEWTVTGGDIIAGSGTYQITVQWGDPGAGTVVVTETSTDDCETTTEAYDVTIDDCTGLEENALDQQITVYPNPAKDYVNVSVSDIDISGSGFIKVHNAIGETLDVIAMTTGKNLYRINTSNLDAGLYLIQIIVDANVASTKKFVIEK